MAPILWLYTWTAEPLYARLGWERVGPERDTDRDIAVVLMKRNLPLIRCALDGSEPVGRDQISQ